MVNQGNYATFAARFDFTHHLIKTKTHTSDLNQKKWGHRIPARKKIISQRHIAERQTVSTN